MGFFDLFSGKDDTPPAPEERVIPDFAKSIKRPIEGWITTQVFVDKKDKNKRVYYVALHDSGGWDILKCSYSITDMHKSYSSEWEAHRDGTAEAIRLIAALEKAMQENGHAPVDVLRGNYREAANQNGAYFDDKDNYISLTKDEPVITKDALLDRKGIQALYNKVAEKPAGPAIKTWDDFYREIVYSHPVEDIASSVFDRQGTPGFTSLMQEITDTLSVLHVVERGGLSEKERQRLLSFSGSAFYRAFDAVQWEKSGTEDTDGGKHKIVHDYEAVLLTILMRMGGRLYQQFTASISSSDEAVQFLAKVGEAIETFAQRCFDFSPEQSKQLASVIMQGPDPYADKPLPLEVFFDKHKNLLSPAPKTKPKNPGL